MAKYRKKPIVVEAVQMTLNNIDKLLDFMNIGEDERSVIWEHVIDMKKPFLVIETLEGDMKANVGDYIIKGVNGEYYPCKPDIFEKTYEPVG
ncbi:PGDYG domain-containing protein [Sporolactobacillus terrae]|uniref:PGDYG domain-containing protein n=1 Tax=Sporolactobacillus terrae TaxID=269673 RepID=UPI001CC11C4F|nr:PGDYG domain-containing protein [Sporolactobacillus terrae]UAK17565.1 PGDYG domain-containing protein [Sporolactobacillus terrae]